MDTDITSVARLTEDEVRAVLAAADSAPAAGGSRPWRFHCTPSSIELFGAGTDHDATLACGAALMNLRLAIHDLGVYADVRLAPDPSQPTLLAVIRPDNERPATTRERQLVRMILDPTRTVAEPAAIVAPTAVRELRRAAEIEHAWLVPLSDEQRAALGGDQDGMVVVVGSLHDDRRALLRAGQAVQRVVLTAAVLGLHTSVGWEPVATAAARDTLRTLIGGALSPHAVLTVRPV
ncbi:MAG TPA: hypothetical protein VHF06_37485 [Pseudonocardiaceae bacterium]|jgi:hypothetical protein|nr:hypothetical protein [Pseudonocardiaceae bacterium]